MIIQIQKRLFRHWLINRVGLPMAETSQVENRLRAILKEGIGRHAVSRRGAVVAFMVTTAVLAPIALLRTAPASVRLLTSPFSASSPFEAADKTTSLYDTLPMNPRWMRRVSKSDGVELVGVTQGWGKTATSWQPDGTLLAQPLYRRHDPEMQPQYPRRQIEREFAIRLIHPASIAVETNYQIPVSGNGSFSYSSGPMYDNGVQVTDEHEFNANTGGLRVISAVLPKSLTHAVLRVGVAAGPWHYAASCSPEGNASFGISNVDRTEDEILFGHVLSINGKNILTISDTYVKQDCRIIAIGTNGQVYELHDTDTQNAQKFRVTTVKFDILLAQIKEFRFQTRPYEWVEFKNISLEPRGVSVLSPLQAKIDYIAAVHAHNALIVKAWNDLYRDNIALYDETAGQPTPEKIVRLFAPHYTFNGQPMETRQAAQLLQSQLRLYGINHRLNVVSADMDAKYSRVSVLLKGNKSAVFLRRDVWISTPVGWKLTATEVK